MHNDTCTYDVKYIMGGREKGLDQSYVQVSNIIGAYTARRESAIQGEADRKRIEKTHGEQPTPEPKKRRKDGEGGTPAPMASPPPPSAPSTGAGTSPLAPPETSGAPAPSSSKRPRWQANGHKWLRKRYV